MIHNFYIVGDNGVCVFHEKYGSLEEDSQLISSLLTALSQFTQSVIGENIQTITTRNYKFIFKSDGAFTFVAFTDNSDKEDKIQNRLDDVADQFYRQFPHAVLQHKCGNLNYFKPFSDPLSTILNLPH